MDLLVDVRDGAPFHLIIDSLSTDETVTGAALLELRALDHRGERILIDTWPRSSARVGEYQYLNPASAEIPVSTHIRVVPPEGARSIRILGHHWKAAVDTWIVGQPLIFRDDADDQPSASPAGNPITWSGSSFRQTVAVRGSEVSGVVRARGTEEAMSPLLVSVLDGSGRELMAPEGLPVHPKHGPFIPVDLTGEEPHDTEFSFPLPRAARRIVFSGIDWGAKTATYLDRISPQFTSDHAEGQSVESFIDGLTEDDHLILIDTTAPPLGHETLALRPNNLAVEYAEAGAKVLFVPFGSTQEYSEIISERCAQVPRQRLDAMVNRILRAPVRPKRLTYICSSFPSFECLTRMERLHRDGWLTVYEIRDDMEEFNRVGYSTWYHPLLEARMGRVADLVVTVSRALAEKISIMSDPRLDPVIVPNGVRQKTLDQSAELRGETLRRTEGAVGYVGHLTDSWFDWDAVIAAARALPEIRFEIIGHGIPDNLTLPENIEYLGPKTHEELLEIVPRWQVGLIPFIDSPLTRGVDPNKIYEYFSWGLRVVTAAMGAVDEYPSTYVYQGHDGLMTAIREATATGISPRELMTIQRFAEESSWRSRATTMLQIMEAHR